MIGDVLNKVRKLATDWTTAKAAFLDAAITSRAAASTAVSNVNLTPTRIGYLDNLTDLDAPISGISAGSTKKVVVLTAGSSWTHPADLNAAKYVEATIVGGGGGGGASEGGGGGGATFWHRKPMILSGSSTAYSIGAGGAGGTGTGDGADGTDSVFDGIPSGHGLKGAGTGAGGYASDLPDLITSIRTDTGGETIRGDYSGAEGLTLGYLFGGAAGANAGSAGGSTGLAPGGVEGSPSASLDGGGGGASFGPGADGGANGVAGSAGVYGSGGGGGGASANGGDGGDGVVIIEYWTD